MAARGCFGCRGSDFGFLIVVLSVQTELGAKPPALNAKNPGGIRFSRQCRHASLDSRMMSIARTRACARNTRSTWFLSTICDGRRRRLNGQPADQWGRELPGRRRAGDPLQRNVLAAIDMSERRAYNAGPVGCVGGGAAHSL